MASSVIVVYVYPRWRLGVKSAGRFKVHLVVIAASSLISGWQGEFSNTFPIVGGCSRFDLSSKYSLRNLSIIFTKHKLQQCMNRDPTIGGSI